MESNSMDCVTEKPIPNLRRHNTSPGSAGRAILASVSGGRTILKKPSASSHTSMKSNPYVGWFRHSPSTSPRFQISKKNTPWCKVPSSLEACKNSPHIGWFRHAPPSSLKLQPCKAPIVISDKEKELLWKILQELSTEKQKFVSTQRLIISGHLRGGGKKYMERSRRMSSGSNKPLVQDLADEGTLPTVNTLSRLASWFLFPVAHDAESSGYRSEHYPRKISKKKSQQTEDSLLGQLFSPYLPSFLEEPPRDIPKDVYAKYGARVGNGSESELDSDESSSDSDSSTSSVEQDAPDTNQTKDLSLSISSLAEAYYAHQRTTKDYGAASERLAPSLSAPDPVSPHRLDYVITQMDIARMSRNASRHLDVQSILELPVITYRKGVKAKTAAARSRMDQAGWSWTIVEESEGESDEAITTAQGEVDFCVICLEHFVDGDRLRVLPCDHSFHVGCIDRWLSGSQSFEECYTSGCPTCKKRPTMEDHNNARKPRAQSLCERSCNVREEKNRSASLDGSVPSWAFAQIGSALVAQQDQGISICPGASSSE